MQAVILAGGLGTRLGDLTKKTPKPLMQVNGKPFLEWQIDYFVKQGVTDFLLLTGFLGEQIEEYFSERRYEEANDKSILVPKIIYSQEHQPLGTGGALNLAYEKLKDNFLLMFGDSFLPVNAKEVMGELANGGNSSRPLAVMAVYDNKEDTTVPFNVELEGGLVKCYEKGGGKAHGLTHVEAGVYGVRRSILDATLDKKGAFSFEEEVIRPGILRGEVKAFESSERFYDIGTPERLQLFEKRIGGIFGTGK